MTTISIGQLIIIIILCVLVFGDIPKLKKQIIKFLKNK